MDVIAYPVQQVLGTTSRVIPGPVSPDVTTLLARALNRLLTATVDASLADGIGLSIGEAGAREQALEAMEAYRASRTGQVAA